MRVELPVDAHIPHDYVPGERLRLEAYQQDRRGVDRGRGIAGGPRASCVDRYGPLPEPVENLLAVARLPAHGPPGRPDRGHARRATTSGSRPSTCPTRPQLRLKRLYPGSIVKPAVGTILVPRPTTARVGGTPLRDQEVLRWAEDVVESVLVGTVAAGAAVAAAR